MKIMCSSLLLQSRTKKAISCLTTLTFSLATTCLCEISQEKKIEEGDILNTHTRQEAHTVSLLYITDGVHS